MDIIKIVNLALYVPMAMVFSFFCVFFLIAGYKKGFWRSLISLGMSVGATVLSLVLGKLLGRILAGPIAKGIANKLLADADIPVALVTSLMQSVLQAVLTFVFFGIFFVIALILLKVFSQKLHFPLMDKEPADNKGLRLAGMGVRLLDAVIVTLVVLIPLYGPMAVSLPIVSGVANAASGTGNATSSVPTTSYSVVTMASVPSQPANNTDILAELLKTVDQHPTLGIYKRGPASLMVRSLSTVSLGGESIDTAQILWAIEGTIERFTIFNDADGQERFDALAELVGFMRENVIEKSWCYDIVQAIHNEVDKIAAEMPTDGNLSADDDMYYMQFMLSLLDTDRDTFKSNGVALLEFMEYALENDFITFYRSSNYEALSPEFYEKLGALINHSKQAVVLKKELFIEATGILFDTKEGAANFINQYIPDEPLPKELQKQEAEAFMRIFFEKGPIYTLEALVRHPSISYEDVKPLFTQQVWDAYIQQINFFGLDSSAYPATFDIMHKQLAAYETAPLLNYSYADYARALVSFAGSLKEDTYFRSFRATDTLLQDLINTLSDEIYQESPYDAAKIKQLLQQALEDAKKQPGVWGYVDIISVYKGESEQVFTLQPEYSFDGLPEGGNSIIIMRPGEDGGFVVSPDGDGSFVATPDDSGIVYQPSPDGIE